MVKNIKFQFIFVRDLFSDKLACNGKSILGLFISKNTQKSRTSISKKIQRFFMRLVYKKDDDALVLLRNSLNWNNFKFKIRHVSKKSDSKEEIRPINIFILNVYFQNSPEFVFQGDKIYLSK